MQRKRFTSLTKFTVLCPNLSYSCVFKNHSSFALLFFPLLLLLLLQSFNSWQILIIPCINKLTQSLGSSSTAECVWMGEGGNLWPSDSYVSRFCPLTRVKSCLSPPPPASYFASWRAWVSAHCSGQRPWCSPFWASQLNESLCSGPSDMTRLHYAFQPIHTLEWPHRSSRDLEGAQQPSTGSSQNLVSHGSSGLQTMAKTLPWSVVLKKASSLVHLPNITCMLGASHRSPS